MACTEYCLFQLIPPQLINSHLAVVKACHFGNDRIEQLGTNMDYQNFESVETESSEFCQLKSACADIVLSPKSVLVEDGSHQILHLEIFKSPPLLLLSYLIIPIVI